MMAAKKRNLLKNMRLGEVSLVDHPANPGACVVIAKALTASQADEAAQTYEVMMDNEQLAAALEAAEETLAKANSALEAAQEEIAKRDDMIAQLRTPLTAATSDEDVMKSMPEAVRKRFEAQAEEIAKANALIGKLAEEREQGEYIAKAATIIDGLSADAATVGGLLHRIAKGKTTAEDAGEVERLLLAASAAVVAKGLTKPVGSRGYAAAGDASAKMDEAVAAIRKANPGVSAPVAFSKALEENPELYRAYLAERTA